MEAGAAATGADGRRGLAAGGAALVAAGATTEAASQAFDANMGAGAVASGLAVADTGRAPQPWGSRRGHGRSQRG